MNLHAYKVVPIDSVTPYANNPRTHSDEQITQIRRSIREFGFTNPLLIDEGGQLIAGHGRLMAAKAEGLEELPAIEVAGLNEAQRKALVLADNQLAANAGWDYELLKVELSALTDHGFDLSLVGFTEAELAGILETQTDGLTDPDDAPEAPSVPVSALGDVWVLGRHRLVCGDATSAADVQAVLAGVVPHLMVTDPPYGVSYDPIWRDECGEFGDGKTKMRGKVDNDNRADWREAWALFPGDVVYAWSAAGPLQIVAYQALAESGFIPRYQIIWFKSHFILSRGDYHWQHEPCWYAVRKGSKGHWQGDRTQSSVWEIAGMNPAGRNRDAGNEKSSHGTQKPVECMQRPIENNSAPGEAVYDPFVGSGTTIIACEMTGRHCYAIELNPAYVDVAVERWQAFTGETASLEDGRTFAQLKAQRHGQTGA